MIPPIIAYLKPSCGWSNGVRAVLKKYNLSYEDRDIINRPDQFEEMVNKTGQTKQPSLDIGGQIVADVSGEELEAWLLAHQVVSPNATVPDAPTNQPCAHEMPQASHIGLRN
jgi:glutaredoxin